MIEQFLKIFEFGDRWYVDSMNGDDANDGRSWATAKRTIQSAIDVAQSGDTILIRGSFDEDITISYKQLRIVGVGSSSINGTSDLSRSIITVDGGTVVCVGINLGVVVNADCTCILLDDINPAESGDKIVEVFGAVDSLGVGNWIGDPFDAEELTSTKLLEKYSAAVAVKPSPGDTVLVVRGNIAVEPWLSVRRFMQQGHFLFPVYITRSYESITYDADNDVSIISGIDPPFTADTLPGDPPKNNIYLCAVKVHPGSFASFHARGEQIVFDSRNLKNLISLRGLTLLGAIFVSCMIRAYISPYVQFPIPVPNVIFDSCWFWALQDIGRYLFNFLCMPFSSFAVRDSVFLVTEGSGIAKITGLSEEFLRMMGAPFTKDFRDLLGVGGFFHNIIANISFGNFDASVIRDWVSSKVPISKLVIGREVLSVDMNTGEIVLGPLEIALPFVENLWVNAYYAGMNYRNVEVVRDVDRCPVGDVLRSYKDKAALGNVAAIEESLVYEVGAVLQGLVAKKKLEIIK
jgi:hypothetical protein